MAKGKAKWGILGFVAVVALFLLFSFFGASKAGYLYETVTRYRVADELLIKGVAVRNEQVLKKNSGGVICYTVADGSKVAKGQLIGYSYASEAEAIYQSQILQIEQQLQTLTQAADKTGLISAHYDTITAQINQSVQKLNVEASTGFFGDLQSLREQYVLNSARRELSLDQSISFDATRTALEEQKAAYQSKMSASPTPVYSPISGYFISKVDGFESDFTQDTAGGLNVEQIDACFSKPADKGNYIGKVAESYRWNFIGYCDSARAASLYKDQQVKMRFSFVSSSEIPMTVEKVWPSENGDGKTMVLLSCDMMYAEISQIRCQSAQLIINEFTGLKIPKKALRIEGTQKGAYVKYNNELVFKKVDVIFENDSIVLSRYNDSDQEEQKDLLKLYDDVVVEGAELYDGKAV